MKFLLPLILFSFLSVAQDAPKIDPNTGLPTAGVAKKEKFSGMMLDALDGVNTKSIRCGVLDYYGTLTAEVKEMLDNQGELFLRRNRFTDAEIHPNTYLLVAIQVGALEISKGIYSYSWNIKIGRYVYLGKSQKLKNVIFYYDYTGGNVGSTIELRNKVGNALDKVALHIFEATKDQDEKKTDPVSEIVDKFIAKEQRELQLLTEDAEAGNVESQYSLVKRYMTGSRLINGQGIPKDYVKAYAWLYLLGVNGSEVDTNERILVLEPKMTDAQIKEGQNLYQEMIKKNPKLLK